MSFFATNSPQDLTYDEIIRQVGIAKLFSTVNLVPHPEPWGWATSNNATITLKAPLFAHEFVQCETKKKGSETSLWNIRGTIEKCRAKFLLPIGSTFKHSVDVSTTAPSHYEDCDHVTFSNQYKTDTIIPISITSVDSDSLVVSAQYGGKKLTGMNPIRKEITHDYSSGHVLHE
jgi:hypothetical protein